MIKLYAMDLYSQLSSLTFPLICSLISTLYFLRGSTVSQLLSQLLDGAPQVTISKNASLIEPCNIKMNDVEFAGSVCRI